LQDPDLEFEVMDLDLDLKLNLNLIKNHQKISNVIIDTSVF
jgi:hypothetical protein